MTNPAGQEDPLETAHVDTPASSTAATQSQYKGSTGRPSKAASHANFSQGNTLYDFYGDNKNGKKRKSRKSGGSETHLNSSSDSEQPPTKLNRANPPTASTMEPSLATLLASLDNKMDQMQSDNQTRYLDTKKLINGISLKVDDIKGSVDTLRATVQSNKAKSDASIEELRQKFAEMERKIIACGIPGNVVAETALSEIQAGMASLKQNINTAKQVNISESSIAADHAIESLQQYIRRNNVIIKGLKVGTRTAFEEVSSFLVEKLNFTGKITDVRVRRQPIQDKQVITVTLDSNVSKRQIFQNKRALYGTDIFIDTDLTPREGKVAQCIREEARKFKRDGRIVKNITPTSLTLDGKVLFWNKSKLLLESKPNNRPFMPTNNPLQSHRSLELNT